MPDEEKPQKRIGWIYHKGNRILLLDYSYLKKGELIETLKKTIEFFKQNDPANIIGICDITGANFTTKTVAYGKEIAKMKSKDKRFAVVGITGLKATIINQIRKDLYMAKDMEDAKEWVIKE